MPHYLLFKIALITTENDVFICLSLYVLFPCSTLTVSCLFVVLRQGVSLSPGFSAVTPSQLTATSASWVQVILLPQPPE